MIRREPSMWGEKSSRWAVLLWAGRSELCSKAASTEPARSSPRIWTDPDMPRPPSQIRRPKGRKASTSSRDWLTGFHPVREALRARRRSIDGLLVREKGTRAEQAELVDLARSAGIPVEWAQASEFEERVEGGDGHSQGVALRAGPLPESSLRELVDHAREASVASGRLVVLDGVEDPQNVGALARVADAAGFHGLILTERRAPPLSAAVSRASAGAIEWLRVARVSNLGRTLRELKKSEYWIVAAAPSTRGSLFEMEDRILCGNLAVVLGAEGKGIRPSILELSDHRAAIPMRGHIASLNVSTAGAVILYDLLRRVESSRSARPENERQSRKSLGAREEPN